MERVSDNLAGFVQKEITARKEEYRERDKLIHGLRKIRFMRQRARPPKAVARWMTAAIRAPIAYRLVQTATGSIYKRRGATTIRPRKPGDEAIAENLQQGADLLLQTLERIARKPLELKFIDQCAGDGMGVRKLMRTAWEGYPIRDTDEGDKAYNKRVDEFVESTPPIPLRERLVDPLTFYPSRSEWSEAVMESGKRPTRDALKALRLVPGDGKKGTLKHIPEGEPYPQWEPPPSVGPDIQVDEIWTPDEIILNVGGEVFKLPNDEKQFAGKIPYCWAYGEVTGLDDPALASLSVIFPLMYLQPWLDTLLGSMAAWSIVAGNPTPYVARDAALLQAGIRPTDEIATFDFHPGKMYDFGVGAKAGFLEPPPVGGSLVEFINLIITLMDRVSLAPIASGFIGTRTPGLTQAAAMEAAVAKLTPIVENAQFATADFIKLCFHVIENIIRKPLWVSGYIFEEDNTNRKLGATRLAPADIKGHYDVMYSLRMETLQDEIARGTHAAFMENSTLWSRRRSQKFSGVDNPTEEDLQIAREKVLGLPLVQAWLAAHATDDQPTLMAFAEFLRSAGISPTDYISGVTPMALQEAEPEGPGQGLGQRNLGGQPKRGGGRPSGSPTQRPRGRR